MSGTDYGCKESLAYYKSVSFLDFSMTTSSIFYLIPLEPNNSTSSSFSTISYLSPYKSSGISSPKTKTRSLCEISVS